MQEKPPRSQEFPKTESRNCFIVHEHYMYTLLFSSYVLFSKAGF